MIRRQGIQTGVIRRFPSCSSCVARDPHGPFVSSLDVRSFEFPQTSRKLGNCATFASSTSKNGACYMCIPCRRRNENAKSAILNENFSAQLCISGEMCINFVVD